MCFRNFIFLGSAVGMIRGQVVGKGTREEISYRNAGDRGMLLSNHGTLALG